MKALTRSVLILTIIVLSWGTSFAEPIGCFPDEPHPNGAVFLVENSPHIWLFEDGIIRWVGDTRALAEHTVRWDQACVMHPSFLNTARKGDPILSAALVKIGDPIYLAKWERTDPAPTLLQIRSVDDLEAIGINSDNYERFVFERERWERTFGFDTSKLALITATS